jgi:uncharacterized membrane protein YbjE (DUF340 family)
VKTTLEETFMKFSLINPIFLRKNPRKTIKNTGATTLDVNNKFSNLGLSISIQIHAIEHRLTLISAD